MGGERVREIDTSKKVAPNGEMLELREMLDKAGIAWHDESDFMMCRTQQHDSDGMVFSAVCGEYAYGNVELWTRAMQEAQGGPRRPHHRQRGVRADTRGGGPCVTSRSKRGTS